MTEADWAVCGEDTAILHAELSLHPDRKLHLLTAAFLRRVWDQLPCDHTRYAVEATEQFADGRVSAAELAWVRSQAAREAWDFLWLDHGSFDDYVLVREPCCPGCDRERETHERRVWKQGGMLDGVWAGINDPARIAASAAGYAWFLEYPGTFRTRRPGLHVRWWQDLYPIVLDILGGSGRAGPIDPAWLTPTVRLLARGIDRDRAFDRLPILADALGDAGCTDDAVLAHCRRPGGHVRGCWALDLILVSSAGVGRGPAV